MFSDFDLVKQAADNMRQGAFQVKLQTLTSTDAVKKFTDMFQNSITSWVNPCYGANDGSFYASAMEDLNAIAYFMDAYALPFYQLAVSFNDALSSDSQGWLQGNWQNQNISGGNRKYSLNQLANYLRHYNPGFWGRECPNIFDDNYHLNDYYYSLLAIGSLLPWAGSNEFVDSFFSATEHMTAASSS